MNFAASADKLELVINLETVKAPGPTIPPSLFALADAAIETVSLEKTDEKAEAGNTRSCDARARGTKTWR